MKKLTKSTKMETTLASETINAEQTQIQSLTQERDLYASVANQAAAKLLHIELLATPFINRKFNIFNALFHLQQFVELVKSIVEAIKSFKDQYMKPPVPANGATQ